MSGGHAMPPRSSSTNSRIRSRSRDSDRPVAGRGNRRPGQNVSVVPKELLVESWRAVLEKDPVLALEKGTERQFDNLEKCICFAQLLFKDDKIRSVALAKTLAYLSAWKTHCQTGNPFENTAYTSQFFLVGQIESMQEKLTRLEDGYDFDIVYLQMEDALSFLWDFTAEGPQTAVFTGTFVCLQDVMVHLEHRLWRTWTQWQV